MNKEEPPVKQREVVESSKEPLPELFNKIIPQPNRERLPELKKEPPQSPNAPDLRTRIGNAVKAIKDLGGEVGSSDLTDATDEDLQTELDELTNQYKRLKNSKKASN